MAIVDHCTSREESENQLGNFPGTVSVTLVIINAGETLDQIKRDQIRSAQIKLNSAQESA